MKNYIGNSIDIKIFSCLPDSILMHFLTDACFMVFVPTKFVVDSGKPIYVANNDDTMPCIMVALVRKTFMISISPRRILSRLDEILSRLGDLSTRMDTFVLSAK